MSNTNNSTVSTIEVNEATGEETEVPAIQAVSGVPTGATPLPAKTLTVWKPGKFGGQFAHYQLSVYNMFLTVHVDKRLAHKLAMDWGSQYGNALLEAHALGGEVKTKASKSKGDEGMFTSKVSGEFKAKGAVMMFHTVACQWYDIKKKLGMSKVPTFDKTYLNDVQASYWDKCIEWCNSQQWEVAEKDSSK